MSVIVSGKCKMNNRPAIERALAYLITLDSSLRLERNTEPRYFGGTGPRCDYVLKLQGKYDLGIRACREKELAGQYEVIADNELLGGAYGSDNYGRNDKGRKFLGEDARLLHIAYQTECAKILAEAYGYAYETGVDEEGLPYVDIAVPEQETLYA